MPARSALLAVALLVPGLALAQPRPHHPRGTNLAKNPGFSGAASWHLNGSVVYDGAVSRTAGSGSMRIEAPYGTGNTELTSDAIAIQGGKTYTFAVYQRAVDFPQFGNMFCGVRNSSGVSRNVTGSRQATTAAGAWEESAVLCRTEPGDVSVTLKLFLGEAPRPNAPVWFDEVYFGEGLGFEQPPATKNTFDGTRTRLDSLGNFEVNKNGVWEPFFPFCICTDNARTDWTVYKNAGFNCSAWAWAADTSLLDRARKAGMMAGIDVTPFVNYGGALYQDYAGLEQRIRAVHAQGFDDAVLMYYFDNESFQAQYRDPANAVAPWTTAKAVLERIDATERSLAGGQRIWPRFMISGNEGLARLYGSLVEVVGDYVGGDSGGMGNEIATSGLQILDNVEKQPNPYLAQINYPQTSQTFRTTLYLSLIAGARGFSYWRDTASAADSKNLLNADWRTEVPKLRDEVAAALPVLRRPHWTSWSVTASSPDLEIGTRELDGLGYLLVVNRSGSEVQATFTIAGLSYAPARVETYPAGASLATVAAGAFTLAVPGYGTGIWRLAPAAGADAGAPGPDAAVHPGPDAGAPGPDASSPSADAEAMPPPDAAAIGADAAAGGSEVGEGCGCSGSRATALAGIGALAAPLALRRRRAHHPRRE